MTLEVLDITISYPKIFQKAQKSREEMQFEMNHIGSLSEKV